jgi:glutamine amidotransferase
MIAIIDYESGNLRSISNALEEVGAKVKLTDNKNIIAGAGGIVLPGVGAFHHGMKVLKKKGLLSPILNSINEGKPFLGICLGMQLLFSGSEEHGLHKGLGVIKGRVKKFPSKVKIPHLGWNQVKQKVQNAKCKIFNGIPDDTYFYFVHSYYVEPKDKNIIAAKTCYGVNFTSCIVKGNVWGVQFHPEKSSDNGLKILENFYSYAG